MRWSHLGEMRDNDTQSVLLMSSLLVFFVLVAVTPENSASPRQDVRNGNRLFNAVVAISGYSAMTLIQNPGRVVVSKILLKPPLFVISSSGFSSCRDAGFTLSFNKWVANPFLDNFWVLLGWEVVLKLFF